MSGHEILHSVKTSSLTTSGAWRPAKKSASSCRDCRIREYSTDNYYQIIRN